MKNKKLNLSELKVKSFVTDFEKNRENTVKGGTGTYVSDVCGPPTLVCAPSYGIGCNGSLAGSGCSDSHPYCMVK